MYGVGIGVGRIRHAACQVGKGHLNQVGGVCDHRAPSRGCWHPFQNMARGRRSGVGDKEGLVCAYVDGITNNARTTAQIVFIRGIGIVSGIDTESSYPSRLIISIRIAS